MSLVDDSQRTVAEIDFDHASSTGAKIGNRSIHQFWHIFSAQFRTVLVAPQRRPESGTISWVWRQPVGDHPFTVQELEEVRRRLTAGNRSLAGGLMAVDLDDDKQGGGRSIDTQVRASVSSVVGQLLALSDERLGGYLCRTEMGPMVHSWGAASPAQPYVPDGQQGEVSGTVLVNGKPVSGVTVMLETSGGQRASRTQSDRGGSFRFQGVKPGDYRLRVADRSDFSPAGLPISVEREALVGLELRGGKDPMAASPDLAGGTKNSRKRWLGYFGGTALLVILVIGVGWYFQHRSIKPPAIVGASQDWQSASGHVAEPSVNDVSRPVNTLDGWTNFSAKNVPEIDFNKNSHRKSDALLEKPQQEPQMRDNPSLLFERTDGSKEKIPDLTTLGKNAVPLFKDTLTPPELSEAVVSSESKPENEAHPPIDETDTDAVPARNLKNQTALRKAQEQPLPVTLGQDLRIDAPLAPDKASSPVHTDSVSKLGDKYSERQSTEGGSPQAKTEISKKQKINQASHDAAGESGGSTHLTEAMGGKASRVMTAPSAKNQSSDDQDSSASSVLVQPRVVVSERVGLSGEQLINASSVLIDASEWRVGLTEDIIFPTRPLLRKKGSVDVATLRAEELAARRATMPSTLHSPVITTGLVVTWDQGITKSMPAWVTISGPNMSKVAVTAEKSEVGFSGARLSSGDYRLQTTDGREIMRLVVSLEGMWVLTLTNGVHVAYWMEIASETGETKSGRYEWRAGERNSLSTFSRHESGFRIDVPLTISATRETTSYPVALIDTISGWSLSARVTIR